MMATQCELQPTNLLNIYCLCAFISCASNEHSWSLNCKLVHSRDWSICATYKLNICLSLARARAQGYLADLDVYIKQLVESNLMVLWLVTGRDVSCACGEWTFSALSDGKGGRVCECVFSQCIGKITNNVTKGAPPEERNLWESAQTNKRLQWSFMLSSGRFGGN